MRRIIGGINMSLDGFFDHTSMSPGEEIHKHYEDLLNSSDIALYGRITYHLMEFWKELVEKPSGEKSMDDFAKVMDKIPKIVFSHTVKNLDWHSAKLSNQTLEKEVLELKKQSGGDVLVGSRSLIIQLMKLNLIDELQLCVHPILVGKGLRLFENIDTPMNLNLIKTKTFKEGAIILYYEPKTS